jgi:heat shock protein HtpX
MKRLFLFILTNLVVVATITIIFQLLGLDRYTAVYGIDWVSMLVFCSLWGFGGAFISLLLSKVTVKLFYGVKIIRGGEDPRLDRLVEIVKRVASRAGMKKLPEVGYYVSPEVNAFATGASKNSALVAVSTGLLEQMDAPAVEGVIGHEVAHIVNGDMVTMTLIQGVVNTFVMFLSRIVAFVISAALRTGRRGSGRWISYLFVMLFQVVFGILGSLVTASFSRAREFRADKGGSEFAGRSQMIHALEQLQNSRDRLLPASENGSIAALKISGRRSWMALFSTHPPLEKRIERLRSLES